MPGVHHNLCFDYGGGDCFPRCYHGGDGFKITLKWIRQKILTLFFGKKIYRNGTNFFDADKKPEGIFETCFLLVFYNESLSPNEF